MVDPASGRRDPSLAALEEWVLPELLSRKRARIWVAGCGTGEDAYSLAMCAREHLERSVHPPEIQIFATDAEEHVVSIAREGRYDEGAAEAFPQRRLERYAEREPGGGWRVRKNIRDRVLFACHDALRDPPFISIDLLVCHGVLARLERKERRWLLGLFHRCLRPGAYLFPSGSKPIDPAPELFELVDDEHRIFRPRDVKRGRSPGVPTRTAPPRGPAPDPTRHPQWLGRLHERLAELYAPASLVVNDRGEVVHLSRRAGRHLRMKGGEPTAKLLEMVGEGLKRELSSVLATAFRTGEPAEGGAVGVEGERGPETIRPRVLPLTDGDVEGERRAVVLFEVATGSDERAPEVGDGAEAQRAEPATLQQELRRTRERLHAETRNRERALAEHQSAIEELQSITEEHKVTAEALQMREEELQSLNEELHTVNEEHRIKIEQLGRLNADLENLIDSTDIATIFLDRDLAIRRFTPQVRELFNFAPSDLGRPVGDITHRLDYPELESDARKVLADRETFERDVQAEGGAWFLTRLTPYRGEADQVEGVVVSLVDTTHRKEAELEREDLLDEARKADAAKADFLGVLSHEFRTPLSGLMGYTSLLAEGLAGEVNEQQRKHLARIKAAALQLLTMVEEILTYVRLESREARVEPTVVDPGGVAREVLDLVVLQIEVKGLELVTEIGEDLPPLRTDDAKLRQILTNLLGNAVKFTEEGRVALRVRGGDDRIVFEVEDTGIGIAPEDQERIFDRFWQVRSGSARPYGGTGLGLTVVRELAELLGGGVSLESEPGQGSRFRVWLPLEGPGGDEAP